MGALRFPGAEWTQSQLEGHNGTVLRVVGKLDPPFLSWERRGGVKEYSGFLVDLWRLIATDLHLSFEFTDVNPREFGARLPNGTWNGVVGQLAYDRADVGLSWLSYSAQRARVIEYIDAVPVSTDAFNFFLAEGSSDRLQLSGDLFAHLTRPLHTDVWLTLLACLLAVSLALRVTIRFCRPASETRETRHQFDLLTCHLNTTMSLVGQGWPVTPDSLPARIVTLSGWMLGLLISVNYTANLISHLAVTTVDKPISSIREFLADSDWRLAAEPGLNSFQDWQLSADADYRALYDLVGSERHILLEASVESSRQCLQPKVLCFQDPGRLAFFLKEEACLLQPLLDVEPVKARNYLVLRKGLGSLRKAANKVLQKLKQNGATLRLQSQWFPDSTSTSSCSQSGTVKSLTLPELFSVVLIIPLACLVSALLLLAELVVSRVRTASRRSLAAPRRVFTTPRRRPEAQAMLSSSVEDRGSPGHESGSAGRDWMSAAKEWRRPGPEWRSPVTEWRSPATEWGSPATEWGSPRPGSKSSGRRRRRWSEGESDSTKMAVTTLDERESQYPPASPQSRVSPRVRREQTEDNRWYP